MSTSKQVISRRITGNSKGGLGSLKPNFFRGFGEREGGGGKAMKPSVGGS